MQLKPITAFILGMFVMACIAYPGVRQASVRATKRVFTQGREIVERSKRPQPVIVVTPTP